MTPHKNAPRKGGIFIENCTVVYTRGFHGIVDKGPKEPRMYQVTLQRNLSQNRSQASSLEYITGRALAPFNNKWASNVQERRPVQNGGEYVYTAVITFTKERGRTAPELVQREWIRILNRIVDSCTAARFSNYPWRVIEATDMDQANVPGREEVVVTPTGDAVVVEVSNDEATANPGADLPGVTSRPLFTRHILEDSGNISFEELKDRASGEISHLLNNDNALSDNEHFRDIYGRNAQIRTVLSSVKAFLDSNGQRRNHSLLYGLPACAKTQILRSLADFIGMDAILRLDGSATTPAGLYKLFFDELEVIPPIVILEEAEKANEEGLKVWLGALDDRGELRKINYREMKVREVRVLCLATVNDKEKFDAFLGGSPTKPGPLSSRFVHQLKCPRPNADEMRRILIRDIQRKGGREAWVEPVLRLSDAVGTNDPRRVLGFLDGGDRLLTGEYQKDILTIEGKLELLEKLAEAA